MMVKAVFLIAITLKTETKEGLFCQKILSFPEVQQKTSKFSKKLKLLLLAW
jgi:hypothetical protein